jgi:hypothetical protein
MQINRASAKDRPALKRDWFKPITIALQAFVFA